MTDPESLSARIEYKRLSTGPPLGKQEDKGIFGKLEERYQRMSILFGDVHRRALLEKSMRTKEEIALERASARSLTFKERQVYELLIQAGEAGMTVKEIKVNCADYSCFLEKWKGGEGRGEMLGKLMLTSIPG